MTVRRTVSAAIAAGVATAGIVLIFVSFRNGAGVRTPEQRLQTLDRSLRAIEDGERERPRDTWDLDYVVNEVGRDPKALFLWMRANTYWIPYRGVLRGPMGVLMDRQGNSLDRALLLATLLEHAGHTVRLARGQLSPAQAIQLLPRLESDRTRALRPKAASHTFQADLKLAAAQYGLDGAQLDSQAQVFSRLSSELQSRVADQTARLMKSVPRVDAASPPAGRLESAMAMMADHWWVQRQDRESWVDLDILALDEDPGTSLVPPTETVALQNLPDDLRHLITVRVVAEQWAGGRLAEHTVLEHLLRPSELIGQPVTLQFWPTEWIDPVQPGARRRDRAAALSQPEWNAVVAVGRSVAALGILSEEGDDPNAPSQGGPTAGIARAFARTMGLTSTSENRQLCAVWIEYEILVPGEKPRTIRRTVFDLLGPAARTRPSPTLVLDNAKKLERSLALTMKTEILAVACGLGPEFVSHLLARNLLDNRDLLGFLVKGEPSHVPTDLDRVFDQAEPPLSALYALALARMEWGRKEQVFIDRPNLLTRHLYPTSSGDGVTFVDATDIVANEVGVALSVRDPFSVRLSQGVLDTNAESLLQVGKSPSQNAGDAFAASERWLSFGSGRDGPTLAQLKLSDNVRQQIAADLAVGYAVVAPDAAVPMRSGEFAGWWRIDRFTGDALGFGANGWGQGMAEESSHTGRVARLSPLWRARIATFGVAFAANYGWCFTPLLARTIEYDNHEHGWTLAIWNGAVKPSFGECFGDSVLIAGLTAWLLPSPIAGLGAPAARRALGRPRPSPPPEFEPPSGGRGPKGKPPKCGDSVSAGPEATDPQPPKRSPRWDPNDPVTSPYEDPTSMRPPFKQAYVDYQVERLANKQPPVEQAYKTAKQVVDNAQQALDKARQDLTDAFKNGSPDVMEKYDAELRARETLDDARALMKQPQRDFDNLNFWKRTQTDNQRLIQARDYLALAEKQWLKTGCADYNSPEYRDVSAANTAYRDALSQMLEDVSQPRSPAAPLSSDPTYPLDDTQPNMPPPRVIVDPSKAPAPSPTRVPSPPAVPPPTVQQAANAPSPMAGTMGPSPAARSAAGATGVNGALSGPK